MVNAAEIKEIDEQWHVLHTELLARCKEETDNFEWSHISKLPFKVINLLQPMTWRMRDAEEAARLLIDKDYVHPAAIMIRSAMENTAFVFVLCDLVKSVVKAGKVLDDTDERLMNMSFGNQYRKGSFVPDEVYESMHEHKAVRTYEIMGEIDKIYPGYYEFYKNLCEFVHTNTDGVQGCFSQLDEKKHRTKYGKMLNKENAIFPAIESSIIVALVIFKERYDEIMRLMPQFVEICEQDRINKNKEKYAYLRG